jgi:hypothetical protein
MEGQRSEASAAPCNSGEADPMEIDLPSPTEIARGVSEWARENPHAALAGATAVGFLLGGGVTPKMIGAVGLLVARYYFKQTVSDVLETILPAEVIAGKNV